MSIFIDTSYVLSLVNTADRHHTQAALLAEQLDGRFVTTEAVLVEIGNALSRLQWRTIGISVINALRADPRIEIIPVDAGLFDRTLNFYGQRMDKEWGLTDCISFVVMLEHNLFDALTADRHFQQAGFRALMLEM